VTRRIAVVGAVLALLVSGAGPADAAPSASRGGELRIQASEPQHLVSTDVADNDGAAVGRALYVGLVQYTGVRTTVRNVMAESISSRDNLVWTIRLKPGWRFHNGEPVDADAYLRAWNVGAYGPNAQSGSANFARIQGYPQLQGATPAATTMSGLRRLSRTAFQVTLAQPFAGFPVLLGNAAFMPMARACAADLPACDQKPIGDGAFAMDGPWQHGSQIALTRFRGYRGDRPHLDRLTFKIYDTLDHAYADFVAGNLDLMRSVPGAQVPGARATLGNRLIEQPAPVLTYLGLPLYNPAFSNKKLRQALSLAVDRRSIVDMVFQNRFTPAASFSPPGFPGGRDGTCRYCSYDPERARRLLAAAGGWPGGKKIDLWFNSGQGHDVWMRQVGEQLKQNLGIDYTLHGDLAFPAYQAMADARQFTGPWRNSWLPDYPLNENYLNPLYGSRGPTPTNSAYDNPAFDARMARGDTAGSLTEAGRRYSRAEDILGEDMPGLPLWFSKTSVAYAEGITGVSVNVVQGVDLTRIRVTR
jgi:ABC-type transport system substrate-binding protein